MFVEKTRFLTKAPEERHKNTKQNGEHIHSDLHSICLRSARKTKPDTSQKERIIAKIYCGNY